MRQNTLVLSIRAAIVASAASTPAAAALFDLPETIDGTAVNVTSLRIADLDGDGDSDIVATLAGSDQLVWYELDGTYSKHVIDAAVGPAAEARIIDLDRDGDLDIVVAAPGNNRIAWYVNDGTGSFGFVPIDSAAIGVRSVDARDLDGDGDRDVVAAVAGEAAVTWYENDGTQLFTPHDVTTTALGASAVRAIDVDRDGDLDFVVAAADADTLAWYENDGAQNFSTRTVDGTALGISAVAAADLDRDGDVDLIAAAPLAGRLAWYENDGSESFSLRTIATDAMDVSAVAIADADGDASPDLITAQPAQGRFALYVNDGAGNFSEESVDESAVNAAAIVGGDLDGDTDADVVTGSDGRIARQLNRAPRRSAAFEPPGIPNGMAEFPSAVLAADVDGDGDTDLLSASVGDAKVAWYENDRNGNYDLRTIQTNAQTVLDIDVGDFNRDGRLDVASVSRGSSRIDWNEQLADGSFVKHEITSVPFAPSALDTTDLDNDGDEDLVVISFADDRVSWLDNDGDGNFTYRSLAQETDGGFDIQAVDIDGDGDVDIVTASTLDEVLFGGTTYYAIGKVAWFENDGDENFTVRTISTESDKPRSISIADVDGDGDPDIVTNKFSSSSITWLRNDGSGTFDGPFTISTGVLASRAVFAADLDGDGDVDVLSGSYLDADVFWHENDGSQNFTKNTLATTFTRPDDIFAADIDDDGDLDVLVAARFLNEIRYLINCGGQYLLTAVDATTGAVTGGETVPSLTFDFSSNGQPGDAGSQLVAVPLRLVDGGGTPLTLPEAGALLDELLLFRDTGNGFFGSNDELVARLSVDQLLPGDYQDGRLLLPLDAPNPQFTVADANFDRTFFLFAATDFEAESATPDQLRIRYDADSPLGPVAVAADSNGRHVPECTDAVDSGVIAPEGSVFRPDVELSLSANEGSEAAGTTVAITANLIGGTAPTDETVTIAVSGGGITAGDFALNTMQIAIPAGSSSGGAQFQITDDQFQEGAETAVIAISDISRGLLPGAVTSGTVLINDDDVASIAIDDVTVDETAATATLTVSLTNGIEGGFTVDFATAAGSATDGQDFTGQTGQLAFSGAVGESMTIDIGLADDAVFEGEESFTVTLSNATGGVTVADGSGVVTISDDDTATLTIEDVTVVEGTGIANVTVTLDNATEDAFSVDYATADGTALAGTDYTADNGQLAFTGGVGEARVISIALVDDAVLEPQETLSLMLSAPSIPVILADPTALVTIDDDDQASLAIDDVTVGEADGSATFTVSLSGATQDGFTVDFASSDGTATAGTDYTAVASQLAFAGTAGETMTIEVPILEDELVEGPEFFSITLAAPTGGVTVTDESGTGAITDNDVAPEAIFASSFEDGEEPEI